MILNSAKKNPGSRFLELCGSKISVNHRVSAVIVVVVVVVVVVFVVVVVAVVVVVVLV